MAVPDAIFSVPASYRPHDTTQHELCGRTPFSTPNHSWSGILEKVYENALAHELRKAGLDVVQQRGLTVTYDGVAVGQYFVDLMVEQAPLVKLKIGSTGDEGHRAQCLSYLKASDLRLCLLFNFGKPRLEIKRVANGL